MEHIYNADGSYAGFNGCDGRFHPACPVCGSTDDVHYPHDYYDAVCEGCARDVPDFLDINDFLDYLEDSDEDIF